MMLASVCAMAQSTIIEPAKGDVNSDGQVDVADIVAVINIMKSGGGSVEVGGYFYLGTTQPTAGNYKTLPGVVTTYTSIGDAIGTTASVSAGQTLYMLCPTAWVQGKTMAIEDNSGETINFLEDVDTITISGYSIYKTQVLNTSSTVTLKTVPVETVSWYVGTSKPTASDITTISEYPTSSNPLTYTNNSGAKSHIFVLTNSDKTVTFINIAFQRPIDQVAVDTTTIPGYNIFETAVGTANGGSIQIQVE